jgi:hypothetical protein
MTDFSIRVQLNGSPTSGTYDLLHDAMEHYGCSRQIKGDSGAWYYLPHAEYRLTSATTVERVRDDVVTLADSIWLDNEVVVTEAGVTAWKLPKV